LTDTTNPFTYGKHAESENSNSSSTYSLDQLFLVLLS